ncbi:hypothetical protein PVAND_014644 [Polypedilum vanderplanki]|uniref:Uncharacterized protein n=1 Tax=Polypedilum vanderplanki TaxID=319348 RepID=A0A9J6B9Z4_POLVA|nr:hypothetical protein PVAND_014644 [Polypedilum vanderplanki]
MLDKNFTFYALDTFTGVISSPRVKERTTFLNIQNFHKFPFENLTSMDKVALLATEDHVAYWNKIGQSEHFFSVCPEVYKTVNLAIYFNKNSSMKFTSDDLVMQLIDFGFIEIFRKTTIDYSYLRQKNKENQPKKLKVEQFVGCFYLSAFGLFYSCTVFVYEILYEKLFKKLFGKIFKASKNFKIRNF